MSIPEGTLNLAQIQDAIYSWVNSVTKGVLDPGQIIWRDQGQQIPPRPFVSLKFTGLPAPTDREGSVFLDAVGKPINIGMQMEASLSVQVFGNTQMNKPIASQIAMDLNASLLRIDVRTALKQGGVAIQGVGHPQNLSALEESKYEERAGFDVELGLVNNIGDTTGTIETVNIQPIIDNEDLPIQTITLS